MIRARLQAFSGKMPVTVANANSTWTERAADVLTLRDDDGREARAEVAPLPGYSRETLAECRAALDGLVLPPLPGKLEAARTAIGQIGRRIAPAAARCAVEAALLGILAQREGLSRAALLRRRPEADILPEAAAIPRAALLHGTGDALLAEARAALGRGCAALKVKLGRGERIAEIAALARLRAALGDGPRLRVDFNGSLGWDEAPQVLWALEPLKLEFVEEPVQDIAGLLATRGSAGLLEVANPIALALDESLQGPALKGLIRSGFISGFVLKPMALGILQSRALAERGAEDGLWMTVTHLFDGPLALDLALDLARALVADGIELRACGLDDHPGLVALRAVAE